MAFVDFWTRLEKWVHPDRWKSLAQLREHLRGMKLSLTNAEHSRDQSVHKEGWDQVINDLTQQISSCCLELQELSADLQELYDQFRIKFPHYVHLWGREIGESDPIDPNERASAVADVWLRLFVDGLEESHAAKRAADAAVASRGTNQGLGEEQQSETQSAGNNDPCPTQRNSLPQMTSAPSDRECAVRDILLKAKEEGKRLPAKKIVVELRKQGFRVSDSFFRRHIVRRVAELFGVRNDRDKQGYYIP